MKITKDDIERNLEHVRKGEALDMPLAALDGVLKRRAKKEIPNLLENKIRKRTRKAYQKTDKYKAYKKAYYEANKDKFKAYKKAYYEANKDKCKAYQKAYYLNVTKPKREALKNHAKDKEKD